MALKYRNKGTRILFFLKNSYITKCNGTLEGLIWSIDKPLLINEAVVLWWYVCYICVKQVQQNAQCYICSCDNRTNYHLHTIQSQHKLRQWSLFIWRGGTKFLPKPIKFGPQCYRIFLLSTQIYCHYIVQSTCIRLY